MQLIFVIALSILLAACNPFAFSAGSVGEALKKEVRDKKGVEVDLRKIVPFEWDSLYMFTPYMPRQEICKQLQLTELQCHRHVPIESTDDGEMFLVFRLKEEIVHTEMHSRFNGDFTPVDYPQPITPEQSRFVVIESGVGASGAPWLKLRPKIDNKRSNNSFRSTSSPTRRRS
jgi:hypothetical protein